MSQMCNCNQEFFDQQQQKFLTTSEMLNDLTNTVEPPVVNGNGWPSLFLTHTTNKNDYFRQFYRLLIALDRLDNLVCSRKFVEDVDGLNINMNVSV